MTDLAKGFRDRTFKPAQLEKEIKTYFNKRYKEIEHIAKFIPYSPYPFGEPGTPDKLGCVLVNGTGNLGVMYLLEFKKSETAKTRKNQDLREKQWTKMGAIVLLLDSKDKVHNFIEEVKTYEK